MISNRMIKSRDHENQIAGNRIWSYTRRAQSKVNYLAMFILHLLPRVELCVWHWIYTYPPYVMSTFCFSLSLTLLLRASTASSAPIGYHIAHTHSHTLHKWYMYVCVCGSKANSYGVTVRRIHTLCVYLEGWMPGPGRTSIKRISVL